MYDFFTRLFDPSGFVPRRACGNWTPGLVWLHNASDALIWLAYLAIPLVLLVIARRRSGVAFRAVYFLFIAFILTCGFTHFLDVVMFYSPLYRLSGLAKAMTAVASWATVIVLVPVLPKALAMRSPEELETEIDERRRVEGELRALHAELEQRVALRTAELEQVVATLEIEIEGRKRMEQQLWESREQLRLVTDNVPVMLVHCDTERRYKFANRAYSESVGLTPKELVGRTIPEVVGEQAYERIRSNVDAALAGERVEREVEGPYQGTEKRWMHFTCLPTYSQSGEVDGAIAVILDVTERRKAEGLLRSITDTVPALLAYVDVGGRYRFNNLAYEQWFGQPRSGIAGRHMRDVLGEPAWVVIGPRVEAALAGQAVRYESQVPYESGGMRWIDATYTPHFDVGGEVAGFVSLVNDITDKKKAEIALRESEEQFRELANAMPQIVWMAAPDGSIDYQNDRWYEYTGQPRAGGGDESWKLILHPDDSQPTFDAWGAAVHSGRNHEIEHRFKNAGPGEYRWHMTRAVPVRDEAGAIVRWFGTSTDIHDKKLAEERLKELNATLEKRVVLETANVQSEKRLLDAILEFMPVAVIISEPNGRLVRLNRACDQVWGLNPFMSSSIDEYGEWVGYWPDTGQRVQTHEWALSRALLEDEVCPGELMEIERFGLRDRRFVINSAAPVKGADGRIMAGVVATMDVTDRITAETALRASEAETRMWAEAVPQIVWTTRPDGWNTYFNQRWMDYTGLTREESLGHGWNKPFHPDDQQRAWLAWQTATTTMTTYSLECRLRRADGIYRWWLIRGVPLKDADGNILKWFGTCTDIDDLKRAEAELRESEERFRSAFDSGPLGMALVALDGRWLQVNRLLCELVGYTEQELLATNFQAITHPDDLDADLGHVRQLLDCMAQTYQMEKRYFHKRGHVVYILLAVSLVRDGTGEPLYFVAQIKDITQQKEDEKALAANEALLRQFIKHSPAAIAMFDRDMRYIQTSDRWLIDYHLSGRDIIGSSHYEVFPDASERWKAIHRRVLAGSVEECEEDPFERADGSSEWLQWECRPWRDAEGEVGGIILFTQVITQRKVIEERVKASLREKEVLLKEIHHRVKNNLQVVSTLLDLQSGHTSDPAAREMFKESRGRVKSMALIHERLYRSQDMARVNLGDYVRQLADDLHRTYRVSEGIRLELDVDIPPLSIDIAIPCGLLLNELISNCFKHAFANVAEGCLRVSLRRDGGVNVLSVADDGAGFPTSTDFRDTTSFGLQLVNTMVDQLDGEITLTTDRGTTFTIRFPKPKSSPQGTLP